MAEDNTEDKKDEKSAPVNNNNGQKMVRISEEHYKNLTLTEKKVKDLEMRIQELEEENRKLQIDNGVSLSDSEVKQLTLYMTELNGLLRFLGENEISLSEEKELGDIRKFIYLTLKNLSEKYEYELWFNETDDLLGVIKNIKTMAQTQALIEEKSKVKDEENIPDEEFALG